MRKIDILVEDQHILVCVKPSGIPVQTKNVGTPDIESILRNHLTQNSRTCCKANGRPPYLAVIHRLDQPVEGILVFAKTPSAAQNLNKQLQANGFGKYYQAVVCGRLPASSGTLSNYLVKDGKTNTSRICTPDTPQAKPARLSYEVLKTIDSPALSIVKIHLETGRHHQIRVQMAEAGTPIWGDTKYNPEFADAHCYSQIALCACCLQFRHPETNQKLEFKIDCRWPQLNI